MKITDVGGKEYAARDHELAVTNMLIFRYNHGRWPRGGEVLMTRNAFHEAFQDALRLYAVGVRLEVTYAELLDGLGHTDYSPDYDMTDPAYGPVGGL